MPHSTLIFAKIRMGVVFGYSHIFDKNYAFRIDMNNGKSWIWTDQLAHNWPNSIKRIAIGMNDVAITIKKNAIKY